MQPRSQQISTCPNCGGVLEKTSAGELGCMSCLLRAGVGSEEETVHDSTLGALEGGLRFGVYEIDCREDGRLYELGRGAMGVTYRATDTTLQRKVALKIIKTDIAERSADAPLPLAAPACDVASEIFTTDTATMMALWLNWKLPPEAFRTIPG